MLTNIYNQRITILNKLKQVDSLTGLDVWHKTVLEDAAWYAKSERNMSGNNVTIGTYITVLIPFHSNYANYSEWKQLGVQENNFTMSDGDYIILGDIDEEITAQNVVKTLTKYEPNVCKVLHFEESHDRFGVYVQLKIEGV